jgi:hypothetical protein
MIMQFGLEDLSTKLNGAIPTTLTIMLPIITMIKLITFNQTETSNHIIIS